MYLKNFAMEEVKTSAACVLQSHAACWQGCKVITMTCSSLPPPASPQSKTSIEKSETDMYLVKFDLLEQVTITVCEETVWGFQVCQSHFCL